tara:strand:- start:254 stop:448 length:195 start_codon:yes stop_codon:yes gene_type:complete
MEEAMSFMVQCQMVLYEKKELCCGVMSDLLHESAHSAFRFVDEGILINSMFINSTAQLLLYALV